MRLESASADEAAVVLSEREVITLLNALSAMLAQDIGKAAIKDAATLLREFEAASAAMLRASGE